MKKVLESKMKVRFHDCDPFNHLNNSRYIDYIVTARGDQMIEHYNLDIYKMAQKTGISWVSAQNQISYLTPAYLMEEVVIETQLIQYSSKSLTIEALMWNLEKTNVKAVMWAKQVHYNIHTKKSETHSENLLQLFAEVVNPMQMTDFETRVKALKSNFNL